MLKVTAVFVDFAPCFVQNRFMTDTQDEDVVLEPENGGEEEHSASKIKKLREELKKAKVEAAEYLAGWQRSKADYINLSRRVREETERGMKNGTVRMAEGLIAVFDSLEAAEKSLPAAIAAQAGADTSGTAVASGIAQVIAQLEAALREHDVVRFAPKAGETFDPERHEVVHTVATDGEKEDNTVSETLQSGYEIGGTLIRPARVAVKHYQPSASA